MYLFEIRNPGYFIYRGFFPTLFWPTRWLSSSALLYHSEGPSLLLFVVRGGGRMTRYHCQLMKSPLPSPSQPPLAPAARAEDGFDWHPSGPHPCSPTCHVGWWPGGGRRFGTEKTCGKVEGCTRMRWQNISQISPYMKIKKMLNRNCPRTIAKSGPYPVTFFQLLSVFPGAKFPPKLSNALWLRSLRMAPLALPSRGGIGPFVGTPGEIPGRVKTGDTF